MPEPQQQPDAVYLTLMQDVRQASMEALIRACVVAVASKVRTVHLLIGSAGGDIPPAINAFGFLRALPIDLVTYNVGQVDSIALLLYMAGNTRYANPGSTFLFHKVGQQTVSGLTVNAPMLRAAAANFDRDERRIADLHVSRGFKGDRADVIALFKKGAPVPAEDAVGLGIVHDIRLASIPRDATIAHVQQQP